MSRLNVDKITGATGTASGAPITLSGDTATLSGTGVTFPTGHIIQIVYDESLHQSYHHIFLYQWKTSTPYESLSYELLLCFFLISEDDRQLLRLLL